MYAAGRNWENYEKTQMVYSVQGLKFEVVTVRIEFNSLPSRYTA